MENEKFQKGTKSTYLENGSNQFENDNFDFLDPIFYLVNEVEMIQNINNCISCNSKIAIKFNSEPAYCKFCGYPLCNNCNGNKRKIPHTTEFKYVTVCTICDEKLAKYQNFEENEVDYKIERQIFKEQSIEINKLNHKLMENDKVYRKKEDSMKSEINLIKGKINEINIDCEKASLKVGEHISFLKKLDDTRTKKEEEYRMIENDRQESEKELEKAIGEFNDWQLKINEIEQKIKSVQKKINEKDISDNKIQNFSFVNKRASFQRDSQVSQVIMLNPSKSFVEISRINLKQREESVLEEEIQNKESNSKFREIIMYLGSKIFIRNPSMK